MKEEKKYLFYLGHPAHYHNTAILANNLVKRGHQVLFVARDKDVLFQLLEGSEHEVIYLKKKTSNTKWALVLSILKRQLKLLRVALKYKPQFLIGTDIVITHIGNLLNIPSFVLNEDDAQEVPYLAHFGFRYATAVFSPYCCNIAPYEKKKIGYNGYHELAYLAPNYFVPNKKFISELLKEDSPYFLLRFSDLNAHHDHGKSGISDETTIEILNILQKSGRVFITSEKPLSPDLEPFRINLHPRHMHHALFFAQGYIGDSQTMAAEAAVLGTPSIRINDFKGKLGYLNELEQYGLLQSFFPSEKKEIIKAIGLLIEKGDIKSEYKSLREKMLKDKIDLTAFWTDFFLDYPHNLDVWRNNPNFQNKYRLYQ